MLTELWKDYSEPRYWPTWIGLLCVRLLAFLLLLLLALFGYAIGALVYVLQFDRRQIAEKNISACFPEFTKSQVRWINFQHYCLLGQTLITASMNWWISPARFDRLVTIKGREHYDAALAEGARVILLTPPGEPAFY